MTYDKEGVKFKQVRCAFHDQSDKLITFAQHIGNLQYILKQGHRMLATSLKTIQSPTYSLQTPRMMALSNLCQ